MTTPDVTYRVYASYGEQRLAIKEGFQTRDEAQRFVDNYGMDRFDANGRQWHICIAEEKSRRQMYYEFIDSLLENARRELSSEDMIELINDLGVVLDMHFDGIRREVESEYAED